MKTYLTRILIRWVYCFDHIGILFTSGIVIIWVLFTNWLFAASPTATTSAHRRGLILCRQGKKVTVLFLKIIIISTWAKTVSLSNLNSVLLLYSHCCENRRIARPAASYHGHKDPCLCHAYNFFYNAQDGLIPLTKWKE